jgi:hypothetical protein
LKLAANLPPVAIANPACAQSQAKTTGNEWVLPEPDSKED